MRPKLWIFGSSSSLLYKDSEFGREYIKWKGYTPKIYSEIIAEKLEYELITNPLLDGSCNYRIFETICNKSNEIKNADLIIIGWTSLLRFRLVNESNKNWVSILPNYHNSFKNTISENTISEILYNRTAQLYTYEISNWIKLIDKAFVNNKVIYWSDFFTIKNVPLINYCEKINTDTSGLINDFHFSEKGNLELANILINFINNKLI
jgi:hypothetical protein